MLDKIEQEAAVELEKSLSKEREIRSASPIFSPSGLSKKKRSLETDTQLTSDQKVQGKMLKIKQEQMELSDSQKENFPNMKQEVVDGGHLPKETLMKIKQEKMEEDSMFEDFFSKEMESAVKIEERKMEEPREKAVLDEEYLRKKTLVRIKQEKTEEDSMFEDFLSVDRGIASKRAETEVKKQEEVKEKAVEEERAEAKTSDSMFEDFLLEKETLKRAISPAAPPPAKRHCEELSKGIKRADSDRNCGVEVHTPKKDSLRTSKAENDSKTQLVPKSPKTKSGNAKACSNLFPREVGALRGNDISSILLHRFQSWNFILLVL